jgi:hypothetical protein
LERPSAATTVKGLTTCFLFEGLAHTCDPDLFPAEEEMNKDNEEREGKTYRTPGATDIADAVKGMGRLRRWQQDRSLADLSGHTLIRARQSYTQFNLNHSLAFHIFYTFITLQMAIRDLNLLQIILRIPHGSSPGLSRNPSVTFGNRWTRQN